ncbi:VOC family protein [Actinokineospora auranticolor]|uniref:Glyoxalase-like domain-containing protein n=1 Tax=Actinokineospora auranticolor TaxID=155976 RepID=A0A2S6GTQ2_9PSEU|nr:VOC family protein [Actinokineospora auranticolor]PPK68569.1 hypothetical protein CLV40_105298 [Actinokineospora auranticolor]
MPSTIQNVNIDAADAYALALWWSQVVDHPVHEECAPGDEEAYVVPPEGPTLYFSKVPEPKVVKNRVHLCLTPDIRREAEVDRLLAIGATLVDDRRTPDGKGWAVLADPEGNEFCVLRSAAERA